MLSIPFHIGNKTYMCLVANINVYRIKEKISRKNLSFMKFPDGKVPGLCAPDLFFWMKWCTQKHTHTQCHDDNALLVSLGN